jgi:type IV secretion system protein VirB4
MWSLKEFWIRNERLQDLLPWGLLLTKGVVLNKDGSFQRTFRFRGPDLASATKLELANMASRINNVLKRLKGGWAIYAEAQRGTSLSYPESVFPGPIPYMMEEERRQAFTAPGHFENNYYFTLIYLPPPENLGKFENFFIDSNQAAGKTVSYKPYIKIFHTETNRIISLFKEFMSDTEWLDDSETLTYLHSCISPRHHWVKVPEIPMYLDALLVDSPVTPGFFPKLGDYHLRTITIKGFPGSTIPGMLDKLNELGFEYRWVTRFLPLDKSEAEREIRIFEKAWYSKRKGMMAMVKEIVMQQESALQDTNALNQTRMPTPPCKNSARIG